MSSHPELEIETLRGRLAAAHSRIAVLEAKLAGGQIAAQATVPSEFPEDLLLSTNLLRKSKNRYRKYFNYATDAMFVIQPDRIAMTYGRIADVNKEASWRLGFSREEFFTMKPQDITLPERIPALEEMFTYILESGNATFESVHLAKDGRQIPVEINMLLLHVDGEELILAGARDITERKKAEKDLRESERLYRLLADNVHDVIWTTDTELKPVYISPSINNLSGHSAAEALPVLYRAVILATPLMERFQQTPSRREMNTSEPIHWELEFTRKNGSVIWIESIASPLWDASGHFSGMIGVTRDITSRKTIILELEAAKEQANRANRAKSEFLANMSHEIRTPMNGILGTMQLLGLTTLSDEQRSYVDTALKSGRSLLTIINDILDFSKIEAGKVEIRTETFPPREVLASLIASFQAMLHEPDIAIVSRVDPGVPELLVADQIRFRQILTNLVGNAIKFTARGKIVIHLSAATGSAPGKIRLVCSVTDTGIGLPEHAGSELFEPFSQLEGSFRRKYKGTGLGLSIVRQLVTLMGGTISISGRENMGTQVVFEIEAGLPRDDSSATQQPSATTRQTGNSCRQNILLVEDDLINQQILRSVLEKLGHTVTIAHNGRQALQNLLSSRYDCVLMDIQMPEMDGFEATRHIRCHEQYRKVADIPIIALTAFAMTGDREQCLAAGMNHYLSKPVDIDALADLLEQQAGC